MGHGRALAGDTYRGGARRGHQNSPPRGSVWRYTADTIAGNVERKRTYGPVVCREHFEGKTSRFQANMAALSLFAQPAINALTQKLYIPQECHII